jgi:hypothetical protein
MKAMKRNIIFLLTVAMALTAQAQSIVTLHMKAGTQRHYYASNKSYTQMQYFDINPTKEQNDLNQQISPYNNGDAAIGNVAHYYKNDSGKQLVIIRIKGASLLETYDNVCFYLSTQPNPTAEHHDLVLWPENSEYLSYAFGSEDIFKQIDWAASGSANEDVLKYIEYSIEQGKTYHYRMARHLSYTEKGEKKTVKFYSDDYSFRLPELMAGSGLIPVNLCADGVVFPTPEAWTQFFNTYYTGRRPSNDEYNTLDHIYDLWQQWVAQNTDKVSVTEEKQFDDGLLRLVGSIPADFCEWLKEHAALFNGNNLTNMAINNGTFDLVTDVAPTLGLPSNSYLKISPSTATANPSLTCNLSGLPNGDYQLLVTYAPTGQDRPSRVRIKTTEIIENVDTIPENEVTTRQYDHIAIDATKTTAAGTTVMEILSNTTARMLSRFYNGFCIAEIRLNPMPAEAARKE